MAESEMQFGDCQICRSRCFSEGVPVGIDCACGRHFHIGTSLLVRSDPCIECPACERLTSPLDLNVKRPPQARLSDG